jgi:hypothetical protein
MFKAEPPPHADFLFYYSGPNVAVEPRNSAAKQYLDTTLDGDALAWRNGTAIVETSAVVPLTHKLLVAGFKVVGERRLVQSGPRLYVHRGKWGAIHRRPRRWPRHPARVVRPDSKRGRHAKLTRKPADQRPCPRAK